MLKNLKFIIVVGLIAIGITASNNLESEDEVIEVQKLLKMIQSEIDSSHRNDKRKQSESKNGNDHNLMNIQTLNQIFKHKHLRSDKLLEEDELINKDANRVNKLICAITGSYACSKNDDPDQIETDDDRSLSDADFVNEDKKELPLLTGSDADTYDPESNDFDEEAKNDLESLLNDLEKNLLVQENRDLRCRGNRCGRGILRDREIELIHCKGGICELRIKKDSKNTNQLRCKNNKCGKHRYDDDDDNRHSDLRCGGHRCGRSRANDVEKDDELRCRGHRCGRDRADGDRSEDDGHNHLRCRSNRCKRERAGNKDDNGDDDLRYDTGKGIDELRCKGNRCGEDSDDEYYDDRRKDDSKSDELRCRGPRCRNSRNHITGADTDSDFKNILDNYGKRYTINKELDAIVLDVDKLENVLPTLGTSKNSKSEESKDLFRIFKTSKKQRSNTRVSEKPSQRIKFSSRSTKDKAPFTVSMELGEEDPFKLQERLFTFSDFIAFMRKKQNLTPFDTALNFIKDPRTVSSWNEHFTKAGINVPSEDARYLKKLRNYYHNYVMPQKENYLPYVEKLLKNQLGINKIKIAPGKVIVSLYFGLMNEVNKQIDKPLWRSEIKRLLPLTMKQKKRLHLQGEKEKALAPFVLDVKGLGQVNL